ncbi:MAG: serine/threonine protein kinase [Hyperionvirus sp.]|uniref:Serine/threonine protein kinase n=1 Tax=Hyperionvirus sp. TaxID=2487770 RepID=A0A3G5AG01_9VIRU|nr:MAG: serine/threonine protein kinase [Hyperionvirus sp.]
MSSYSSGEFGSAHNYDWTGSLLNDNYIVIKKIGFGSFSTVWLCYSLRHKTCFAIKILNPEDDRSGEKEIGVYKMLNKEKSSLLIHMIDNFIYVKEDEYVCIVLELMLCSAYDLLKLNNKNGFEPELVKKIIYDTLRAIAIVHKSGIIHTDVKPENMLIGGGGIGGDVVKLVAAFNEGDVTKLMLKATKDLKQMRGKDKPVGSIKERAVKQVVLNLIKSVSSGSIITERKERERCNSDSDRYDSPYVVDREEISSDDDRHEDIKQAPGEVLALDTGTLTIKLSDLGTCLKLDKIKYKEIQTRHYRAPEILLRLKYNEKCDIWSIGCCIYEFITGKVLFNPNSTETISCDRFHVCNLISKIGMIPENLIESSPRKDIFFKKNGLVRGVSELDSHEEPMKVTLTNKLRSMSMVTSNEVEMILDLITKMLRYEPDQRLSAEECLSHEWFKSFVKEVKSTSSKRKT